MLPKVTLIRDQILIIAGLLTFLAKSQLLTKSQVNTLIVNID